MMEKVWQFLGEVLGYIGTAIMFTVIGAVFRDKLARLAGLGGKAIDKQIDDLDEKI
jgi:hypothetical protein